MARGLTVEAEVPGAPPRLPLITALDHLFIESRVNIWR